MVDRPEEYDEWSRVGDLLGDAYGLMGSRTKLGRILREATIALADPDGDEETLRIFRTLTKRFEEIDKRRQTD